MATPARSNPQPAAELAEQMETIWFPIDGFALVCDVDNETHERLYFDGDQIVCGRHRR
jgi:hypothetical protein